MKMKFIQSIGFKIIFFYVLLALINLSFITFIIFENQVELISRNTMLEAEQRFSHLINSIKRFSSEMNKGSLFKYEKDQKSMDKFLKLITPYAQTFFIVTEKKEILHSSDPIIKPPDTMAEDVLRSITAKNFSGKEYYLRIDDKKKNIYCYIPLSDFQLGNTVLVVVKDISGLNESLYNLYRQAIFVIIVVLFFHAVFALALFRYIIIPIRILNNGAEKLSEWDFSTRISLPGRNDEFKSLADSYNKMADSVFKNMKRLKGAVKTSKEIEQRMDNLAVRDEFTGLYNRIYMVERISEEVKRARGKKSTSALLVIDIDNFKEINKIYGTKSGDIIILEISKVIVRSCSDTDIIARFGADNYAVLATDNSKEYVKQLSEKIRNGIENKSIITPDGKFTVTASIGVSFVNMLKGSGTVNDLIHSAETARLQAKQKGKNRVEIIP